MERHAQQVTQSGAGVRAGSRTVLLLWTLVLTAVLAVAVVLLRATSDGYNPQVGDPGKDVVWAPAPSELLEHMLDMAKLTPKDIHYDLGSGDGRTVIAAAKRGARAVGVEYNPDMVALAERNAFKEGVGRRAKFIQGDMFETDFSEATVLTLFLLPKLNVRLRPTILKMTPGTRVVSLSFDMGDWKADQTDRIATDNVYLWIVPAPVAGTWRWSAAGGGPREHEVTLKQRYQQLEGTVQLDGWEGQLRDVKLKGERIAFSVVEPGASPVHRDYTGHVHGDTIEGTVRYAGTEEKWSARRAD